MPYLIEYDKLKTIAGVLLRGLGYNRRQASITADSLTEADARHISSHGVALINAYSKIIEFGGIKLNAEKPRAVFETAKSLLLDGHSGAGHSIADFAVKKTIKKAKRSGICITAVRNANHYGFAGFWTEQIAKEGLIGISATNTMRCVCPTRSAERNLGTNPISVAFPLLEDDRFFLLDMATSVIAQGKLCKSKIFESSGIVPPDMVINGIGEQITDFKDALSVLVTGDAKRDEPYGHEGGLLPLGGQTEMHGGHKGYALALLVEMLTGGLSGGKPSKFIASSRAGISFFFAAFSPSLFGENGAVLGHLKYIIGEYRKSVPLNPDLPVLIPGDKEYAYRQKSFEEGISISDTIINDLLETARVVGKERKIRAALCEKKKK